jgi:hypothetical protein
VSRSKDTLTIANLDEYKREENSPICYVVA